MADSTTASEESVTIIAEAGGYITDTLITSIPYGSEIVFDFELQQIAVGIDDIVNTIPLEYSLQQNYPNPFNPTSTIVYGIPNNGIVTLRVYNLLGEVMATLVNEEKAAGTYDVEFSAAGLPSGIYFYKLQAGNFVESKKMILLK